MRRPIRPILCRLLGTHRGQVDYILGLGAFWMCERCGQVVR